MRKKTNIFLDLDMTVIYSSYLNKKEAQEEGDRMYDIEENKKKALNFNFYNMEGLFVIFERPGLQKFLDFLFENFNVSVWTAASQDYANFIVKNIIIGNRERKLDHFFFYYHGEKINELYSGTSKNLRMLWEVYGLDQVGYNKNNTLILDDNDDVYSSQKDNCLIAKEFSFYDEGSENEDFLARTQALISEYVLKEGLSLSEAVKMINDATSGKK